MGINRLVFFRTDGNSQIASGHLMRCISIGEACRKMGMEVHFLVSDEESMYLLRDKLSCRFPVTRLADAVYDQLDRELPELLVLLAKAQKQNPVLLIDSYFVTKNYFHQVRNYAKVAYLDDLRLFDYPVDLLVNYDVIPDSSLSAYRLSYQNAGRLLLGAKYAPLRNQFSSKEAVVREKVSNILITTGGGDNYHFCLSFIKHLYHLPFWDWITASGITIRILLGYMNSDKAALTSLAESAPALKLYENIIDMASFLEECDLAISAAGTTLYELCALGIPTISYTMADNQLTAAKAFASEQIIPYAGDIRTGMDTVWEALHHFLAEMTADQNASYLKRKSAHETMRRFIDGSGSAKIAEAIRCL